MNGKNKTRPHSAKWKSGGKTTNKNHTIISSSRKFRSFDDLKLISPSEYYRQVFPGISANQKWAKVLCPFHDDTRPSLSINLVKGCYRCHSCGAKGGGIAKFHMERWGFTWKQAVAELEVA